MTLSVRKKNVHDSNDIKSLIVMSIELDDTQIYIIIRLFCRSLMFPSRFVFRSNYLFMSRK